MHSGYSSLKSVPKVLLALGVAVIACLAGPVWAGLQPQVPDTQRDHKAEAVAIAVKVAHGWGEPNSQVTKVQEESRPDFLQQLNDSGEWVLLGGAADVWIVDMRGTFTRRRQLRGVALRCDSMYVVIDGDDRDVISVGSDDRSPSCNMRWYAGMKRALVLILVAFCTACQTQTSSPVAPPSPEVTILPPVTPSATPDCQAAVGVTVQVLAVTNHSVGLQVSGLQPGEIPFIFYSTAIRGVGARRGEAWAFARGADEHGDFSTELTGLQPLDGQSKATWDIRVVHRRGVACAEVTLP